MIPPCHPQVGISARSVDLDADAIPTRRWDHETQLLCPDACLCHATPGAGSRERIARQIQAVYHEDDPNATNAVYTLECRARSRVAAAHLARSFCHSSNPWYAFAATNPGVERIFYVGRASDLSDRLRQHVEGGSAAANFTTLFPPVRLVDLDWFRSGLTTGIAERKKAEVVRGAFPDAFVYQS